MSAGVKVVRMRWQVPRLWYVVLALIVVPLGWLAILGLARWSGLPLPTDTQSGALLTTVGGITGAIFAVGGLVIALVAVLTQLQLKDRVDMAIAQAQDRLVEKFEKELMPSLLSTMQRQVEGRLALFQAALAQDWKSAEQLTREAIEQYPDIQGARSFLGTVMSQAVERFFLWELHGRPPAVSPTVVSTAGDLSTTIGFGDAAPPPSEADVPKVEAMEWLTGALEHQDNPDGTASAALAVVYGIEGAYEKMLDAVRETRKASPERLQALHMPDHLAMLVYACHNDPARVQELGQVLGLQLPASEDEVCRSVEDAPKFAMFNDQTAWYALLRPRAGQQVSPFVTTIRLFRMEKQGDVRMSSANIFPHGGGMVQVPPPTSPVASTPPQLPVHELVRDLAKDYMFVCRYA